MTGQMTAGTGAITPPATCPGWRPTPADPGQRPVCVCGRERGAHGVVPVPRRPTDSEGESK